MSGQYNHRARGDATDRPAWEDTQVRHHFKIPHELTLAAFAEDKEEMPLFASMEALRKDLLQ